MLKAILIAVSNGFGGYGDYLFALKLSQQLKKKYADASKEVPPIYIVTQEQGKKKIADLKSDVEFGVSVLTPSELGDKIVAKEIEIGHIFEGPVFSTDLMDRIDGVLTGKPVLVTLLSEYGFCSQDLRNKMDAQAHYLRTKMYQLYCDKTLYSGFNEEGGERGILVSDDLVSPPAPDASFAKLDKKIRKLLVDTSDIADYPANTELSMQYSHDKYQTIGPAPAVHFLKIHCEFVKNSKKNQDVVMVGNSTHHKLEALCAINDQLIANGFEQIYFCNADNKDEHEVYDSGKPGKFYKVIYTAGMSHESMIACTALSGQLTGATGDQSLGEALSGNRMMVYECLAHKKNLIKDYDAAMIKESGNDPQIIETLNLLRTASTDEEYQRLGGLLRDTDIQSTFTALNKALIKKHDFVSHIVREALGWDPALGEVAALLPQGKQEEALCLFDEHPMISTPEAIAILTGKASVAANPTILLTETGFYQLNPAKIGKGGWGDVHAARHYSLNNGDVQISHPVAIKQVGANQAVSMDKECRLFETAHPEKHFARFEKGRKSYLAMPLFSGVPLDEHLLSHHGAAIRSGERQLMAVELFNDLKNIHEHGVTHNDIKPKNILFDPDTKKMHILDFGCAEHVAAQIKYNGINTAKYAIEYMPPEYVNGTSATTANDIYSMTLTLAEILGVNKKDVVKARMEKALIAIEDEQFKLDLRQNFESCGSLDETLFSKKIYRYHKQDVFEQFVSNYVSEQYDFSSSREQLGESSILLLNAMQATNLQERPTVAQCLEQLKPVSINPACIYRKLVTKRQEDENIVESPAPSVLGKPDQF